MEGARYLEDGRLTIFKRSGVCYARIRLSASGKYIWRSLKTTDEQTASLGVTVWSAVTAARFISQGSVSWKSLCRGSNFRARKP